jgi:hypothetical protein
VEEVETTCLLEENDRRNFLFLFPYVRDCISFPTCDCDSKRSNKSSEIVILGPTLGDGSLISELDLDERLRKLKE